MRTYSILLFLLFLQVSGLSCYATEIDSAEQHLKIAASIDKGVAYLKGKQKPDGSWPKGDQPNFDVTSLCTLALLNSGVASDDQCIQQALQYLRNRETKRAYTKVEALVTMVFCRAEPKNDIARIARNVKRLTKAQRDTGEHAGGWHYYVDATPYDRCDPANSEWAIMALDAAHGAGIKAGEEVWQNAFQFWKTRQNPNGSWSYSAPSSGTGSMTCAGLSSLLIVKTKLKQVPDDLNSCLNRGMKWLETNFTVHRNPPRERLYHYYYLYGLSRVARVQHLLPERDWYRATSEVLLGRQNPATGAWEDHLGVMTDTCLVLLTLSPKIDSSETCAGSDPR